MAPAEEGHKAAPSTNVDLTAALQRLQGFGRLNGDEITVQLIPVPAPGVVLERVGTVVPASIEIVVL